MSTNGPTGPDEPGMPERSSGSNGPVAADGKAPSGEVLLIEVR